MSRTLYGHYIATIKGDDYILHKDYTELQNKYYKQKEVLDKIKEYIENNSLYEEEYDYDYEENIHLSGIDDTQAKKDILKILEEINE